MNKRQSLRLLGALSGALFSLTVATSSHYWYHGRRRLGKWSFFSGAALNTLFLYSFLVPKSPLTGRVFYRGNRNGNHIALTFDDGPRPPFTEMILDVLKQENVPATFFVLGENAVRFPETVRRIEKEGHRVANHGMDHSILMFAGAREAISQITGAQRALNEAGLENIAPLFRAPHGWLSPLAYRAIRALGYHVVAWSKGVWDTAEPGVETIISRTGDVLVPGTVLLLHDGWSGPAEEDRSQTAAALPGLIRMARARGLEFVTLEELMEEAGRL